MSVASPRTGNLDFYRARAAEASAAAEAATLDHVRERCRRSEAAWAALAATAERTERLRTQEHQRKAALTPDDRKEYDHGNR